MLVADTSAWIEYLRGTGSHPHTSRSGPVSTPAKSSLPEPVKAELLVGAARTPSCADCTMLEHFDVMLVAPRDDFDAAVDIHQRCRRSASPQRAYRLPDRRHDVSAGLTVLHPDSDLAAIARWPVSRRCPARSPADRRCAQRPTRDRGSPSRYRPPMTHCRSRPSQNRSACRASGWLASTATSSSTSTTVGSPGWQIFVARHGKVVHHSVAGHRDIAQPTAGGSRHHLAHLLDDQADHRGACTAAVGGRRVRAERPGAPVHPFVRQHQGVALRQRHVAGARPADRADAVCGNCSRTRPAHLRIHVQPSRRRAVPPRRVRVGCPRTSTWPACAT